MRWYLGYPVLAAGLAFAGHIFFPGGPQLPSSGAVTSAPAAAVKAEPVPTVVLAEDMEGPLLSRLEAFSPGAPLRLAGENSRVGVLEYLAQLLPDSAIKAQPVSAPEPVTLSPWKSAVVPAVVRTPDPAPALEPALQPAPSTRVALARDIQIELQRVGCYLGEIDGIWGGGSRRAIMIFLDRVNAALPSDEPDVFMLSLVRSERAAVCGASCPDGQSLTASGRCVPSTLMAQGGTQGGFKSARADRGQRVAANIPAGRDVRSVPVYDGEPLPAATWETVVAEAQPRRPPPYGRMGIGGPRPPDGILSNEPWNDNDRPALARLQRTAVLEPQSASASPAADEAMAAPLVAERMILQETERKRPRERARATANSRPKPERAARAAKWRNNYRHVQRLFEHPLGRM